jgi:hypothetical protein
MLAIREAQLKTFEDNALDEFIEELAAHCREFAPHLCKTLRGDQLRFALRWGVDRAEAHDFTLRGPTRFYVEMMFLFGSGFDTDPQYPWAAKLLAGNGRMSEMDRSEALYARTMEYLAKVDGENHVHTLKALADLSVAWRRGQKISPKSFEQDMIRFLSNIHPRKVEEIGGKTLWRLIHDGRVKGEIHYGFQETRSLALMVVMMFTIGHQFDTDPLHPWISETLEQTDPVRPDNIAEKLERRALLWLDAVLHNAKGGE